MYFVFKSALTVVTLFPEIDLRMRFFALELILELRLRILVVSDCFEIFSARGVHTNAELLSTPLMTCDQRNLAEGVTETKVFLVSGKSNHPLSSLPGRPSASGELTPIRSRCPCGFTDGA